MTTNKQRFAAELEPLLLEAEKAIVDGNKERSLRLSIEILELVAKYSEKLNRTALREVLNSPTAETILKRLLVRGVN